MSRPFASNACAFTKTSNAVSVPSRAMRLARRSSWALCMQSNQPGKLSGSTFAAAIRAALARSPLNARPIGKFTATAAAFTIGHGEARLVFHPGCPAAGKRAGALHRLDMETETVAAGRTLFFSSPGAGCALLLSVGREVARRSAGRHAREWYPWRRRLRGGGGGDGVQILRHRC